MASLDIYQHVTDRIIAALERGVAPWRHPIVSLDADPMPHNFGSGRPYRGVNVFMLGLTAWERGFQRSGWLTYNQARELGGQVRRGEKSTLVIFWKRYTVADRETGEDKAVPVLKYFRVFNVDQVEGLSLPEPIATDESRTPIDTAEQVVSGYPAGPTIEHVGHQACYLPGLDTVRLPEMARFVGPEEYYSTLFHELGHSTGHSKRLARGLDTDPRPFGSPDYSKEELIAEMTAAFLCGHAGIGPQTIENNAAYLGGWIRRLKSDTRLVVVAAGAGQRAADHILDRRYEVDQAERSLARLAAA